MASLPLGHICWNRQVAYLKQQPTVSVAKGQVWQLEVSPESFVLSQMDESYYLILYLVVTRVQTCSQRVRHCSLTILSWTKTADLHILFLLIPFIILQLSLAKLNRKLAIFTTLLFLCVSCCTDLLIPGSIKNVFTQQTVKVKQNLKMK